MKLSIILDFFLLCAFALSPASLANEKVVARPYSGDPSLIYKQDALEDEGRRFEKLYRYDLAMKKYEQALKLEKELHGDERGRPLAFIIRVLQKQGRYEEALKKLRYLKEAHPKHELYDFWEKELEALIEFSETKDPAPIYDHLAHIKKNKAKQLPPNGLWSETPIVAILRLYDVVGDYDAGIAFIDEILSFLKKQKKDRGEDSTIYDRIKTSKEATACADLDKKMKKRNPEWRACNLIREYLLVREAFKKDKAEGAKGRATKALIQSDYFPW